MSALVTLVSDGTVVVVGITDENRMWFVNRLLSTAQRLIDAKVEEEDQEIPSIPDTQDPDPGQVGG